MMKSRRILILIFLFIIPCRIFSQNLVPNTSFEMYSSCPTNQDQVYLAVPWVKPNINTPDYFNSCYSGPPPGPGVPINFPGHQFARTGQAYCGFGSLHNSSNSREYIEVRLADSLIIDRNY